MRILHEIGRKLEAYYEEAEQAVYDRDYPVRLAGFIGTWAL